MIRQRVGSDATTAREMAHSNSRPARLFFMIVCHLVSSVSPLLLPVPRLLTVSWCVSSTPASGGRRFVKFVASASASDELPVASPSSVASSSVSSSGVGVGDHGDDDEGAAALRNSRYLDGLFDNMSRSLDKYVMSGSPGSRQSVYNLLDQVESQTRNSEVVQRAHRMIKRAGLPIPVKPEPANLLSNAGRAPTSKELGRDDPAEREARVDERKQWEASRSSISDAAPTASPPRSNNPLDVAADQAALQSELRKPNGGASFVRNDASLANSAAGRAAATRVSEIIAKAGGESAFCGEAMGIGGLDDVLAQVRRRVWVPLAAPPNLLRELGISPVRGLLLYGAPGNGKSLLARKLGQILSPMRPITVVSGPEILDRFVGSSEKNLREIFDNPPDIYDTYRLGQSDSGVALAAASLHVIIMDEFDAIARSRGGRGGAGDQGDAGVARDSVVNQLLAKMDGVDPLVVPTLVIGLTNRRSLIEPALLRPGRFEVQVEVPPPRSIEQRISILKVHTKDMNRAGRLLIRDPPRSSPAHRRAREVEENLPIYDELLQRLAELCKGFSGASISAVCRAAASHALERAVEEFTHDPSDPSSLSDCVVTQSDFDAALVDVLASQGFSDWSENVEDASEADGNMGNNESP